MSSLTGIAQSFLLSLDPFFAVSYMLINHIGVYTIFQLTFVMKELGFHLNC